MYNVKPQRNDRVTRSSSLENPAKFAEKEREKTYKTIGKTFISCFYYKINNFLGEIFICV
jgi:hypothetical protein